VGRAVRADLEASDYRVVPLVRDPRSAPTGAAVLWDPRRGIYEPTRIEGVKGVVHLAGENIAGRRWTPRQKKRIRDSRVEGTRALCASLAKLENKPEVLVAASAIGVYGHGDESVDETAPAGSDFLAEVCREWESACTEAVAAGIRVVNLRIGVVLSPEGGALGKMLTPFKCGVGGRIASGEQWMSWVHIDDVAGAVRHCIEDDAYRGPVNAVAPEPVTNAEFTKTLGRVLGRPTVFPMPAFAARLAFGEMADSILINGQRVLPARLEAEGYPFEHRNLEGALRSFNL
jgi:uncharacterized protein (TIGR01777 family)